VRAEKAVARTISVHVLRGGPTPRRTGFSGPSAHRGRAGALHRGLGPTARRAPPCARFRKWDSDPPWVCRIYATRNASFSRARRHPPALNLHVYVLIRAMHEREIAPIFGAVP